MSESISFEAIGSWWEVEFDIPEYLFHEKNSNQTEKLINNIKKNLKTSILECIETYDQAFSRFRPDSLVTQDALQQIENTSPSPVDSTTYPEYSKTLFEFYQSMEKVTEGLFTAQVGKALSDIGYDAQYSLGRTKKAKTNQEAAMDTALDYGAAGKGQLVGLIGEILQKEAIESYIVNGSGDILHAGSKPIRVGLEHPQNHKSVIGVSTIQNSSLCGSAPNRRSWGQYHHILNPHTLESPKSIAATWVQAESPLQADGLATALFICTDRHIKKLKNAFDFEHLILYTNGSVQKSAHFQAELFM